MIVDLMRVTTRDGLRLDGAFQPPMPSAAPGLGVDAVCFFHGTGSNFYGSTLFDVLGDRLREQGCGVLRANTRGHDLVSTAARAQGGGVVQGAAYEVVDQCRHDVAAWMERLRQMGATQIGLLGHSLGALKVLYAIAQDKALAPHCAIAVSPPLLSYERFCSSPRRHEFLQSYQRAEQLVQAGESSHLLQVTFPLPMVITAAGYVEKYGPEERYNYLRFATSPPCPALVTFGEEEMAEHVAFQEGPELLRKKGSDALAVEVIPQADHFYSKARNALAEQIIEWLKSTLDSPSGESWQI